MWGLARHTLGHGRTAGLRTRPVRFELLETRTLLSVSPAGSTDTLECDPALTLLAAADKSASNAAWIDALTVEQSQVREELLALLDRGGKIDELENFQPVLMPETFLDELYDRYGADKVWDSFGPGTMEALFGGELLIQRGDTHYYLSDTLESLTTDQSQVREELLALLDRGGKIDELENFQPVLMPEAFLDELYDTFGVATVWDSLGGQTMAALFGSILDSRGDTRVFPSDSTVELTPEQTQVREELLGLLDRGGTIDELENFQPVLMPETFLDELYGRYGVTRTWDFLMSEMSTLFEDQILLNRGDTPFYIPEHVPWPNPELELIRHDAGQFADNGAADYFEVTRTGNDLVLTISEDVDPTDEVSLVVRSTVNLDATQAIHLYIHGSSDRDIYRVQNLGDFAGEITVEGTIPGSTSDYVQIYDTAGDDVWIASERVGRFAMENAYRVVAYNIGGMHGYAKAGGNDQALLYGNDDVNKLKAYEADVNLARVYKGGIYHRAKFFESVEIDGNGGEDVAIFYGTNGDDEFVVTKGSGEFRSPGIDGFVYSYTSFERVDARASSGTDVVHFQDSEAADVVRARPGKIDARALGAAIPYLTVRGADRFVAEALTDDGESDVIKMHDADTDDLMTAELDGDLIHARFYLDAADGSSLAAADAFYESLGFEVTKGYSSHGSDKRQLDGVDVTLLAWSGSWESI